MKPLLLQEDLERLGFVMQEDKQDIAYSSFYFKNENFEIEVDCARDVYLSRRNPDTDPIKITIDNLFDLERLIDWIE